MNLSTTIIGVSILLLIILAMILLNRSNKMDLKQIHQKLFEYAEKKGCQISDFDYWNNKAIAFDKKNHKLFYFQRNGEDFTGQEFSFSDFNKCNVTSISKTINDKQEHYKIITKLDLALNQKNKNAKPIILNFFNAEKDLSNLNGESSLADKWLIIINAELSFSASI